MRIFILSILFTTLIYNFVPGVKESLRSDVVKLNMSAIKRKIAQVQNSKLPPPKMIEQEVVQKNERAALAQTKSPTNEAEEKEPAENWNSELKDFLTTVDPEGGSEMHDAYINERDSYQKEFNTLATERSNLYHRDGKASKKLYKENKEAIEEYDQMLTDLEYKHEQKLKEVLGAYYDQVKELNQHFDDSVDNPEEDADDGRVSHGI